MIGIYNTRAAQVQALRIILGATSRAEIRGFCPDANVGVLSTDKTETDIRWVYVPNGKGQASEMSHDGDWLVRQPDGSFIILSDHEFSERYVRA